MLEKMKTEVLLLMAVLVDFNGMSTYLGLFYANIRFFWEAV